MAGNEEPHKCEALSWILQTLGEAVAPACVVTPEVVRWLLGTGQSLELTGQPV